MKIGFNLVLKESSVSVLSFYAFIHSVQRVVNFPYEPKASMSFSVLPAAVTAGSFRRGGYVIQTRFTKLISHAHVSNNL